MLNFAVWRYSSEEAIHGLHKFRNKNEKKIHYIGKSGNVYSKYKRKFQRMHKPVVDVEDDFYSKFTSIVLQEVNSKLLWIREEL